MVFWKEKKRDCIYFVMVRLKLGHICMASAFDKIPFKDLAGDHNQFLYGFFYCKMKWWYEKKEWWGFVCVMLWMYWKYYQKQMN